MDLATHLPQKRDLWLARLYYLSWTAGGGFISPFINLFYTRIGLDGTQIGLTAATGAIIALLVAPVWIRISEQRQNPRRLLQLCLLFTGMAYLWLGQQTVFGWIILATAVRSLIGSGMGPLSDAMAVKVTNASGTGFGSVRMWGSLGWAIFVLISGWLIEKTSIHSSFTGAFLAFVAAALIIWKISPSYFFKAKREKGQGLLQVTASLLKRRSMIGAGLMIILIGFANSGVGQFEIVFMDKLGASGELLGIAGMISSVVEIPFMLWSDRLTRRFGSHRLLMVAMLMYVALRGMVLAFPTIPAILAERGLGGIAFSFYTVSLVKFISEQTEPHETGTALAVYTVTLTSLIGILAPPLAGAMYDRVGILPLFGIAMAGYLASWLVLRLTINPAKQAVEAPALGIE